MAKVIGKKNAAQDEDNAPAAPAKKTRSFGALFDETPAGSGGSFMPAGKHNAAIIEFILQENEKGLSAVITYEGRDNDDEAVDGKKLKQWYKLQDDKGAAGAGVGFLKADLETLGYEGVTFDALEDTLAEITKEEPMVVIQVKQNGQYTNAYLQGLIE